MNNQEFLGQYNIKGYGNNYCENKRSSYLLAFIDHFKGNTDLVLRFIQHPDPTGGADSACGPIDLFWAICLPHQIRAYFYFKDLYNEIYKDTFEICAKRWTEIDPADREHPDRIGSDGEYGPKLHGKCVDLRQTENLRVGVMTSVYLLSEALGNTNTANKYSELIRQYTERLELVDMSEWDSEAYLPAIVISFLNLYDYSQNQIVKDYASRCLDWFFESAAIKYYHGHFVGPSKRCGTYSFEKYGTKSSSFFGFVFGQDIYKAAPECVYFLMTTYKVKQEWIDLAKKNVSAIHRYGKPYYDHFKLSDDHIDVKTPYLMDTVVHGDDYQFGYINHGDDNNKSGSPPDVRGFEMAFRDSERGARKLIIGTNREWKNAYITNDPKDKITHLEDNIIIWLRKGYANYKIITNSLNAQIDDNEIKLTYQTRQPIIHCVSIQLQPISSNGIEGNSVDSLSGLIIDIHQRITGIQIDNDILKIEYDGIETSIDYNEI